MQLLLIGTTRISDHPRRRLPILSSTQCTNAASFFPHPSLCPSPFAEQGPAETQLCDAKRGHQETENIKPHKKQRPRGQMQRERAPYAGNKQMNN